MHDCNGYAVTGADEQALSAIENFQFQLLSLGPDTPEILDEAAKSPKCPILQIYAAALHLYAQAKNHQILAGECLKQVQSAIHQTTEREQNLFRAIKSWQQRDYAGALRLLEQHCQRWKKDLLAIKFAEFMFFCSGQKHESWRFLTLTNSCLPENSHQPFFLAIHSFALELNGRLEEAKKVAEKALEQQPINPWADHTLTHVYINQGDITRGIHVLEEFSEKWKASGRAIHSHNLWHLGLMYLEDLDFVKAHEVSKRAAWEKENHMVGEEIDAAALHWRLDMEDQGDENLWHQLAEGIHDHANYGLIPFLSAQLCYALKRGGRERAAQEALAYLEDFAKSQTNYAHYVWNHVGIPLIKGGLAFAEKDYRQAVDYLDPIIDHIGCVGGSDAQIDLFHQTYLKSLIGTHRFTDAKAYLNKLTHGRELTKLEQKWHGECS